jgi:hypothetical protein
MPGQSNATIDDGSQLSGSTLRLDRKRTLARLNAADNGGRILRRFKFWRSYCPVTTQGR